MGGDMKKKRRKKEYIFYDYYFTLKMAKNWLKQHNKPSFFRRAKIALAEGLSPPQDLEVDLRSGLYLLVSLDAC